MNRNVNDRFARAILSDEERKFIREWNPNATVNGKPIKLVTAKGPNLLQKLASAVERAIFG